MRGDVGSLIGLHRGGRGDSLCWLGPRMRMAMSNPISMTRTTGATRSIIHFQSRCLLTVRRMVRCESVFENRSRRGNEAENEAIFAENRLVTSAAISLDGETNREARLKLCKTLCKPNS